MPMCWGTYGFYPPRTAARAFGIIGARNDSECAPMRLMLCTCLLAGSAVAADGEFADAIYLNGDILTGEALSGAHPVRVQGLAVRGGRVLAAGPVAEVTRLRGP